jgi:hypothetical protein
MPLAGRLVLVLRLRRAVVALVLLLVAAAHTSVAHAYDLPDL